MTDPGPDPDTTVHTAAAHAPEVASRGSESSPGPPDREVFTAFYRDSAPRLVGFLRWQGAGLPDAAECAQEALIRCYQRWSSIEHHHAWCRLVASRLYTRRLASLEQPAEDASTLGSPLITPASDLDALEQRHEVLRILDLLPSRQRQVMAWTYDGATSTEIAKVLKITPEAVRASLMKARATLRAHLHQDGGEY